MIDDQFRLIQKAQTSLRAARLLESEALYDFAVSRAYYAMFYVAEALLLGEGATFSKHSAVIAAFGQRFVKTGRVPPEFHRYLIEGQASRTAGDYDIGPGLSREQATELIDRAEKFLTLAGQLIGPAPADPRD